MPAFITQMRYIFETLDPANTSFIHVYTFIVLKFYIFCILLMSFDLIYFIFYILTRSDGPIL